MVTDGKPERYLDLVHKALSKDSDITERNKSILKDLLETVLHWKQLRRAAHPAS